MQGCDPRCRAVWMVVCFVLIHGVAKAAELPASWIDDAQLNDVQFVGSKLAFAVGEHGAFWKSDDGGRHWARVNCGFEGSLRSVCFLNDLIGWVAGREVAPVAELNSGVLLATRDGGKTWERPARTPLPLLNYVKFFDLESGVIVGQPNAASPAGILTTEDGGKSWHAVQGRAPREWLAASFVQSDQGAVAGANAQVSLFGNDQLLDSQLSARGYRSIRSISVLPNKSGWLAGDGGLVLRTSNGGLAWESPPGELPDELRDAMDFRAVEVRDDNVWLAGSPGSVVWHSPDRGQHWVKQLTGQSAPIAAMRFSNPQQGIVVGTFGMILRTENGGQSWQAVRGDGRRTALLALHARAGRTSAPLLAKVSGELGFRSAVWIAQRDDVGPLAGGTDGALRLSSAVQNCGGNAAEVHWQLPLTVPGVEYSSRQLVEEWQKQTEGRLPQTLLGGLVRQIRTWRPNVIVIDQPSPDDAASQLLYDAAVQAVTQASDATRYVEHAEVSGLSPWTVDRIFMRLAPGGTGDAHVDLDEFLPHLKVSTRMAASSSTALLQARRVPLSEAVDSSLIAYRRLKLDGKNADGMSNGGGRTSPQQLSRDFFAGLSLQPGSAACRASSPFDEADLERLQKLVRRQRDFSAYTQKSLDDPRIAGQMVGQIKSIVEGMDPAQGTALLRDLADEYRKRSQYELVEATYVELIRRYPKEPGALDAMRWLIQFWCSSETAWQRSRQMTSNTTVSQSKLDQRAQYVQQAAGETVLGDNGLRPAVVPAEATGLQNRSNFGTPVRLNATLDLGDDEPSKGKKEKKATRLKISSEVEWRTGAISEWHTRASELAKQLESVSPNYFRSQEIQFPLAAMRRTKGSARAADAIMRGFMSSTVNRETREVAEREIWASFETPETPDAVTICRSTSVRPNLDGLLSDACWEEATEISLSDKPILKRAPDEAEALTNGMTMFAYDSEFLYVACSCPRPSGAARVNAQLRGREHDADLSRQDRITIRLDVDRDYSTWYEFQVDPRGWTTESCWEDRRWNPKWFVAAENDETHWRIEAAIPWSELTPVTPRPGMIYALSVLRTIPNVGLQSWTHPAMLQPQPGSFGLLKFE